MAYHNWKLGTINIRTGNDDEKIERIINEIDKANLTICGLQEVRRLNTGSALIKTATNKKYELYWSGQVSKRQHGVGFVIKVDPSIEIIEITSISPRIIVAEVIVRGCSVKIINCYAPTEESTVSTKDSFYRLLRKQFETTNKKQKILCIGDFNASSSASWSNTSLREGTVIENLTVNDNGERFHQLFNDKKLSVLNTWFTHKQCRRVTWHSPDGKTKKVYDFILCCSWLRQYTTNCRVYNSFDFDSDHRLVIATLNTPSTRKARYTVRKKTPDKLKINFSSINDEMINLFHEKMSNSLNDIDNYELNTNLNKLFVDSVRTNAESTFPKQTKIQISQPWHNDEKLQSLFDRKSELINSNADQKLIMAIRKKIRMRAKYLKNEHFRQEAEKLNTLAINRELDKLFCRARSQETTLKPVESSCPTQKLMNHFQTHFNPNDPSKDSTPDELCSKIPIFVKDLQKLSDGVVINDDPPNIEEIQKHLQALKPNKACNDIEPELLRLCNTPIMLEVLHRMILNLWNNLDLPVAWGNSQLKTLWKGKGSKRDPTKYRGISIGSTVCKLIISIILSRLKSWYETQLSDEQYGFRPNRGTTDGIYEIKRIHQITNRKQQPLYLLFVDLSAAFDHIPRKWLFKSIDLRFTNERSPRMFQILETLYSSTSLTYEDYTFETTSGVRQGGPESPFLFNLYIDFVMRVFSEKCRNDNAIEFFTHKYRINPNSISRSDRLKMRVDNLNLWGSSLLRWCGYADDLVLFLLSVLGLQNASNLLDAVFSRFGLSINLNKTETMILNHSSEATYPSTIININNSELNNVSDFKYLGSYIQYNQPNTGERELNHRIQLATAKFAQMSRVLQNFSINLRTRILFLNSFVRSRLVYSCQNWNLNSNQMDRLDVVYRTFLRKMIRGGFKCIDEAGNDYRLQISNARLHEICHTSDVSNFVRCQQYNYAAHVARMPPSRTTKLLMFNDDRYTKKGRPVKTLLDQVIENKNINMNSFCALAMSKKLERSGME